MVSCAAPIAAAGRRAASSSRVVVQDRAHRHGDDASAEHPVRDREQEGAVDAAGAGDGAAAERPQRAPRDSPAARRHPRSHPPRRILPASHTRPIGYNTGGAEHAEHTRQAAGRRGARSSSSSAWRPGATASGTSATRSSSSRDAPGRPGRDRDRRGPQDLVPGAAPCGWSGPPPGASPRPARVRRLRRLRLAAPRLPGATGGEAGDRRGRAAPHRAAGAAAAPPDARLAARVRLPPPGAAARDAPARRHPFGFFRGRSHDVVAIDDCPVLHPGWPPSCARWPGGRRHPGDFAAVAEVRADADWAGAAVRLALRDADGRRWRSPARRAARSGRRGGRGGARCSARTPRSRSRWARATTRW